MEKLTKEQVLNNMKEIAHLERQATIYKNRAESLRIRVQEACPHLETTEVLEYWGMGTGATVTFCMHCDLRIKEIPH